MLGWEGNAYISRHTWFLKFLFELGTKVIDFAIALISSILFSFTHKLSKLFYILNSIPQTFSSKGTKI